MFLEDGVAAAEEVDPVEKVGLGVRVGAVAGGGGEGDGDEEGGEGEEGVAVGRVHVREGGLEGGERDVLVGGGFEGVFRLEGRGRGGVGFVERGHAEEPAEEEFVVEGQGGDVALPDVTVGGGVAVVADVDGDVAGPVVHEFQVGDVEVGCLLGGDQRGREKGVQGRGGGGVGSAVCAIEEGLG